MFCTFIRYGVPMMYLNLGQDDEAYNFIKFWLWETKKTCDKNMSCHGNSINHKSCPGTVYKYLDSKLVDEGTCHEVG